MAHCDDEVFFSARILQEIALGNELFCVYITNCHHKFTDPKIRLKESYNALAYLGVARANIFPIGIHNNFPDGQSFRYIDSIFSTVQAALTKIRMDEILTLAWEGGHVDHDVAHLIARALANSSSRNIKLWEFSAYHAYRCKKPWYHTMALLSSPPASSPIRERRLTLWQGIHCFAVVRFFKSQWQTWLGLGLGCLVELVLFRRERSRLLPKEFSLKPPHPGSLLYEQRFKKSYEEFFEGVSLFCQTRL